MKQTMMKYITALVGILMLCTFASSNVPEIPELPAPITRIVSIQPFELEQSYQHKWSMEKPEVQSGYILVLKVDRDLVYPRQTAEPVLYVDKQTAERINHGSESGYVIAIVPAVLKDPDDPAYLDLEKALIWFGNPELPERVDKKMIEREHQLANSAKIKPATGKAIQAALDKGGDKLTLQSRSELDQYAAQMILEYSPQEEHIAKALLQSASTPPVESQ